MSLHLFVAHQHGTHRRYPPSTHRRLDVLTASFGESVWARHRVVVLATFALALLHAAEE